MCASSASRLCECWLPDERPGAELGPHGQRHLGGPAGHERQLRGLVEQLIETDAEEVEVHELHDGPHARHRGADAEPDDRALRDRRVAHAVAEAVVQAAHQTEHVAARGHVDAGDEDPLVRRQLHLERGADRVHRPEDRRVGGRCRRLGALGPGTRHEVVEARDRGRRAAHGPRSTAASSSRATSVSIAVSTASSTPADRSRSACTSERVARVPLVLLVRRSVPLGVTLVVAVPPVGRRLDEDRAGTGSRARRRPSPSPPRSPRRRCRRPRRTRRRTPPPAARATPRAASTRVRTRRSRCSRRRAPPAAARPRPG